MAFQFGTNKLVPTKNEYSFASLELTNATEALNNAWAELTDAQRSMDEVSAIMENINTSVELIHRYGNDSIRMLNVDGGLEALIGIPERVITIEKAMEAMDGQQKTLWQKFKEYIMRVWQAIKNLFKALMNQDFTTTVVKTVEKTVEIIKEKPVVVEKVIEKPVTNGVAEEEARVWESLANESAAKLNESQQKVKELQAVVDALKNVKITVDDSATGSKLDEMNKKISELSDKEGGAFAKLQAMIEAIGDPSSKTQLEGIIKKLAQIEQFYRENNNKVNSMIESAKEISEKVDQSRESTLKGLGWTNETLLKHAAELKKVVIDNAPKIHSASDAIMADVNRITDKVGEVYDSASASVREAADAAKNSVNNAVSSAQAAAVRVKKDIATQIQKVGAEATKMTQQAAVAIVQTKNKVTRPLNAIVAAARAMGEAAKNAYDAEMAKTA